MLLFRERIEDMGPKKGGQVTREQDATCGRVGLTGGWERLRDPRVRATGGSAKETRW